MGAHRLPVGRKARIHNGREIAQERPEEGQAGGKENGFPLSARQISQGNGDQNRSGGEKDRHPNSEPESKSQPGRGQCPF